MQKFDCFLFNNGFDVLKLRLAELADHVDWFVLVESPHLFSGKTKPLYFKENPITGYKIIHVVVEAPWTGNISEELIQNNVSSMTDAGFREGTKNVDPSDLGFFGDFDEIMRPSKLLEGSLDQPTGFMMDVFSYYLNFKVPHIQLEGTCRELFGEPRASFWPAMRYRFAVTDHKNVIPDGGWHLTSFGGPQMVKEKLAGFPNDYLRNLSYEEIEVNIREGKSMFREEHSSKHKNGEIAPLDKDLPKSFLDDPKKWQNLVHPDFRK